MNAPRFIPWADRYAAFDSGVTALELAHEKHKARIKAASDRLERVADILGKVGAV